MFDREIEFWVGWIEGLSVDDVVGLGGGYRCNFFVGYFDGECLIVKNVGWMEGLVV